MGSWEASFRVCVSGQRSRAKWERDGGNNRENQVTARLDHSVGAASPLSKSGVSQVEMSGMVLLNCSILEASGFNNFPVRS